MSYVYLALAILVEVAGTVCLKLAEGLTRLVPSVLMVICYVLSWVFLALVLKKMSVGFVYAVWSGIGTALIAAIGIVWFKEPVTALKMISLALIIIGVIGLNLGER